MISGLGKRILTLRKSMKLSQSKLAKIVGITEATLSRYENGLREPKAEIIISIARALNTSTDDLLGNKERKQSDSSDIYFNNFKEVENLPIDAKKEIFNYIEYVKYKFDNKK